MLNILMRRRMHDCLNHIVNHMINNPNNNPNNNSKRSIISIYYIKTGNFNLMPNKNIEVFIEDSAAIIVDNMTFKHKCDYYRIWARPIDSKIRNFGLNFGTNHIHFIGISSGTIHILFNTKDMLYNQQLMFNNFVKDSGCKINSEAEFILLSVQSNDIYINAESLKAIRNRFMYHLPFINLKTVRGKAYE